MCAHTIGVRANDMEAALAMFRDAYPAYATTDQLDALRDSEYRRLDQNGEVYLDYTGGSLYADSQLRQHLDLLQHTVFGNPHSANPTSQTMTRLVEAARTAMLAYFHAAPDEYAVIFTANASGALKLVGEAYPFGPGDQYLLTSDNHNSVNGIREFARANGATTTYVPVLPPALRIDAAALATALADRHPGQNHLFAYPAQSNFAGVQHDLAWIATAQAHGWDVLLDGAAFTPTNTLDLSRWHPDFVTLSFYKMFGYPTGVGCLIVRHAALRKLRRPWFAGGTITIASVQADSYYLAEGAAGFEDGTVNYLSIPAVEIGLHYLAGITLDRIHTRVMCLTGWLIDQLTALRHRTGRPLVTLYGPRNTHMRGSTITMNFTDCGGYPIDCRAVEEQANRVGISLRSGCFCNPGAAELAFGFTHAALAPFYQRTEPVTMAQLADAMSGRPVGGVRVSFGIASTFADAYQIVQFAQGFLDR
jgi:selenocysteine lyase/cysteine desulfurase